MEMTTVIIGAGPAGMAAATTLAEAGLRPIVIDEGSAPGGQIFRQPQRELLRSPDRLYGFDAARAVAFDNGFASLGAAIEYRSRTQVWAVDESRLHLAGTTGTSIQPWTHLIVAPGAMDKILPLKGWTAPGVSSLGGAQISLKVEAAAIGRQVVFAGSGPLLYLVAHQYSMAGIVVGGVLEVGRPFAKLSRLPGLISGGKAFARGLFYMAALRSRGIPLLTGVKLLEVLKGPDGRVSGVFYRWRGRDRVTACDALAIGHGLKAETQIADLLGLNFTFDEVQSQWLPVTDEDGRSSAANVYLAGDGLSIRGSQIAEASGRLAAYALLEDIGRPAHAAANRERLEVRRASAFRSALDQSFHIGTWTSARLSDDVIVCRCEGVTAGTIRKAVAASTEVEINRIKAFCRVGMGRCQGRLCAAAACEIVAAAADADLESVGRMRGQAPIKPVPLAHLVRSQP